MAVVVQKYGGSSVADVDKLKRVAEKVVQTRAAGNDVVVVISAMGKSTDRLVELAHSIDKNPPRRELDMLVTTGERVSMALLSMAIQTHGQDAISFTGSQCGIITNDRHFDARIIEVRPFRIEDELARGKVVIVAGYQGMSYRREITTLGRGGSDTTAIALAAALGAERAEIYSDVDGVYSADPRLVSDAEHLERLSYEEMQEMAEAGAKVLNSTAVEFARRAGIAIHARSTFTPGRETVVGTSGDNPNAVVGRRDLTRVVTAPDRLGAVRERLDEAGTSVRRSRIDGDTAELLVADWPADPTSLVEALELLEAPHQAGLGAVTVVSQGLVARAGFAEQARLAMQREGLMATEVSTGPLGWTAVLPEAQVDDAVRLLHRLLRTPAS
ncbi:MAG: aspartate kinase [Sandaracinaceae bacterium]